MKKTLLLCFIHGFKGDDNTFGGFPEHLRALVSHALPKVDVATTIYPKFETRGDLKECVGRFREWLQDKVIDLEVAAGTPSPTVDPSVRTILIGHSMGGIVAAETFIAIASETPLSSSVDGDPHIFLFPYIQAVLAFDTPYLGIAPGVVAHGAEGHYNTASTAISQLSGLAGGLGLWGAGKAAESVSKDSKAQKPIASIPEAPNGAAPFSADSKSKESGLSLKSETAAVGKEADAAATPAWQRWGKVAMFAGAAGAVAAGGAAAYLKRDEIGQGWGWIGSHLEFVGCLMRGEELKKRIQGVISMGEEREVGFANMYTVLGKKAKVGIAGSVVGKERTFCSLPISDVKKYWTGQVNDKADDEIAAHMGMFFPRDNPGYYDMSGRAASLVADWTENGWYESSTEDGRLSKEMAI